MPAEDAAAAAEQVADRPEGPPPAARPMTLQVSREPAGRVVLSLSGEIDVASSPEVQEAGSIALATDGCRGLAIDMAEVTFLDSTGLGALVALRNLTLNQRIPFEIMNPSRRVRKLFDITGLANAFGIE
jgi:anti-sigma B factor antagonist